MATSIQPGGTVSFEHRNIKGLNRSILGSVTSGNLLNPQVFNILVVVQEQKKEAEIKAAGQRATNVFDTSDLIRTIIRQHPVNSFPD
ncbi:TOC75 protein [Nymphaea thermarum]|nr:TOC75 protein [Nymphaea thermarum]